MLAIRRVLASLACMLAFGALAAPVAAADPAIPTNYRSRVLEITPTTKAISVKVVGGDGFLELEVRHGHTATVAGYQGEPWLRVSAEGHVQENQHSPSTFLNANRYGKAPIPNGVTAESAATSPVWKTVDRNGRFVWHDHRIHYMTPQIRPTMVPGTNRVAIGGRPDGKWVVPMTVDGRPTSVIGELNLFPAPNPLISWGVVVASLFVVAGLGCAFRRHAVVVGTIVIAAIGAAAAFSGWRELEVVPAQAGANPITVGLPLAGIALAVIALILRGPASKAIAVLAGAAALIAWALLHVQSFDKAIPLGALPHTLARLITAGTLGAAAGAAIAAIASGGLALQLPSLDLDDDEIEGES